jgi:maltose O-acetyltransferase
MQSEKEKMLAGQLYNSLDRELVTEREYARELVFDFNQTRPTDRAKRKDLLNRLILAKGSFYIEPPFHCDYGYNIEIGDNFYANFGCVILDVCKVQIGDNALLAPNVQIYTAPTPRTRHNA